MKIRLISEISGTDDAIRRINQIVPRMVSPDAQKVYLAIGRTIERAVERRQPQQDSGKLKRATVTRGVSQAQVYRRGPAAIVLVRTREGDANAAPHAYPIESGQREKKPTKGRFMVFRTDDGRLVFTSHVKEIKPHPFFEPGVADAAPAALAEAAEGLEQLILRIGR